MVDIFGQRNNNTSTRCIKAHEMRLRIEGNEIASIEALVQNVSIQYQQPIQIIREVGSKTFYEFAQPPSGSVTFGRIVSKTKNVLQYLPNQSSGSNIWHVPDGSTTSPTMTLSSEKGELVYIMDNCIVTSLGISTDASVAFLQEQVAIQFGSLKIKNQSADSGLGDIALSSNNNAV